MKMSDVFNLPLEVRDDLIFFSKSETCYAKVEGVASRKEELEVSSAIHKAVNNHDRLEQENAELREALKYLIETSEGNEQQLNELLICNDYGESEALCKARQLLNK